MRFGATRWAAIVAIAAGSLGCDSFITCDRSLEDNPFVRYTEGTVEDGVYMTSPWEGELLNFQGGTHYSLVHGLGERPRWVQSYLSFDRRPTDGGHLAQSAGNQVVILRVTDEVIQLANDSCVDYWLLVSAGMGDEPPP